MNPVGAVFVAVGYWKMCGIITAKLSAIGAKFGALAGTAGSIVGACLDALTGAAIAGTIFDAVVQGTGIEENLPFDSLRSRYFGTIT
ncbi:MAG TPA: hypothetical protein IAC21_01935 [Candidatus Enterenecus merdae]|nr:hypothetical protein [Candidatus Enterenecus merdae]